jgi:hypothetical protein
MVIKSLIVSSQEGLFSMEVVRKRQTSFDSLQRSYELLLHHVPWHLKKHP